VVKSVHHGYPCSNEEWGELIEDLLRTGKYESVTVKKVSIVKPRSAIKRKLPVGADFIRETTVNWKWDYKRNLLDPDIWRKDESVTYPTHCWTKPWEYPDEAWEAETLYLHNKRKITIRSYKRGGKKRKSRGTLGRPKIIDRSKMSRRTKYRRDAEERMKQSTLCQK